MAKNPRRAPKPKTPPKVPRFWVSIGPQTVVPKNKLIAGVAVEAKGWCLQGYEPALHKEEGAYPTGVVRFRQKAPGKVEASWEPHPYSWNPAVPQWATVALNLINS